MRPVESRIVVLSPWFEAVDVILPEASRKVVEVLPDELAVATIRPLASRKVVLSPDLLVEVIIRPLASRTVASLPASERCRSQAGSA